MMNEQGYQAAFQQYERARAEYARLQQEIHEFLARFTGDPKLVEAPFVVRDLARMEGLRFQRDETYRLFTALEQAIFDRLGKPWAD